MESQSPTRPENGSLRPHCHLIHRCHLRHRPPLHALHLASLCRHRLELPLDSLSIKHGGMRRAHHIINPCNMAAVPETRAAEGPVGSAAPADEGRADQGVG